MCAIHALLASPCMPCPVPCSTSTGGEWVFKIEKCVRYDSDTFNPERERERESKIGAESLLLSVPVSCYLPLAVLYASRKAANENKMLAIAKPNLAGHMLLHKRDWQPSIAQAKERLTSPTGGTFLA